jgi:hypothetical protein
MLVELMSDREIGRNLVRERSVIRGDVIGTHLWVLEEVLVRFPLPFVKGE